MPRPPPLGPPPFSCPWPTHCPWPPLSGGGRGWRLSRRVSTLALALRCSPQDQDELLDAIKSIKPDADSGDVSKMLDFADSDGDKEVSFEEFKLIMQNMQKPTLAASSAN